jgi:hypothetical protein
VASWALTEVTVLVLVAVYVPPTLMVVVDSQKRRGRRVLGSNGAPLAKRSRVKNGRNFILNLILVASWRFLWKKELYH